MGEEALRQLIDTLRSRVVMLEAENTAKGLELERLRQERTELKRELEQARVQCITHEAARERDAYQDEELKGKE